jgi:hypothetical protein
MAALPVTVRTVTPPPMTLFTLSDVVKVESDETAVRVTFPLNPFTAAMLMLKVPTVPMFSDTEEALELIVKSTTATLMLLVV